MQCDIKPSNAMMGVDRQSLHVIDFALTGTAQSGEPPLQPGSATALTLLYEQSESCSRVFAGTY